MNSMFPEITVQVFMSARTSSQKSTVASDGKTRLDLRKDVDV